MQDFGVSGFGLQGFSVSALQRFSAVGSNLRL